ncbi:hypothetical protein [Dietzia sp.]|uniref:hypothetical protein n=1 Tax=Dietzia sp. TaxID=1871616 RepID=UPI002FDAF214
MANSMKRTRTASVAAGVGAIGIGVALFAPAFAQAADAAGEPSTNQAVTAGENADPAVGTDPTGENAGQTGENAGQTGENAGQTGENAGQTDENAGQTGDSPAGEKPSEDPEPGSLDELLAKLKALGLDTASVEGSLENLPAGSLDNIDTSSLSDRLPDASEDEPTEPEAPAGDTAGQTEDAAFADTAADGKTTEDPNAPKDEEKKGVVADLIKKLQGYGIDTSSLESSLENVDTSSLDSLFPSDEAPTDEEPTDEEPSKNAPADGGEAEQTPAAGDATATAGA